MKNDISRMKRAETEIDQMLAEMDENSQSVDPRRVQSVWKSIERDLLISQSPSRHAGFSLLQRVVNVAACFVVIVAIVMPAAMANSGWFRSVVYRLVLQQDVGSITAKLDTDAEKDLMIPKAWKGLYYSESIPNDFQISAVNGDRAVELTDSFYRQIFFEEYLPGDPAWIDTAGKNIEKLKMNDMNAYIIEGDENCTIIWPMQERLMVVSSSNVSRSELIAVCKGIKRIVYTGEVQ